MEATDREKSTSKIVFLCAAAFFVSTSFLYFYNILEWRNRPDFGFAFRTATGTAVVGMVTERGRIKGIEVGDRILQVNGQACATLEEIRSALYWNPGDENRYLVQRDGTQFELPITNISIGFKQSFSRSGFLFLLGLCYISIGILVFMMKPHRRESWIFFLVVATFGLFTIFLNKIGKMAPVWLETIHIFVYTLTPATFIHLALSFPQERDLLKRRAYVQLFPYVVSIILFLFILKITPTMTDIPRSWLLVLVAYIVLGQLVFLGSCLQLRLTSSSQIVKARSRMILLGAGISASMPLLDFVCTAFFGFYILPSFNFYLPFFIVFPIFVGYAIVKHDLFDIEAIIKRTYGYVLTTAAIAIVYALTTSLSDIAFAQLELSRSPLFPLAFVLAVVFLFNPVRNRAQRFVDRVFYRLEYNYQDTVRKISETMRSLLKLDDIVKSIIDTAMGVMFIESGSLLLLSQERPAYERVGAGGEVSRRPDSTRPDPRTQGLQASELGAKEPVDVKPVSSKIGDRQPDRDCGNGARPPEIRLAADHPFIESLASAKKEVTVYDIQEDPMYETNREACAEAFDQLGATLIVPLIYEERLIGLISLGEKKSGKFYRREDINLLKTLANQGAVAIENALLLEEMIEKERMEEELAIARDLQMSMLPAACPEIEGFELAALSIPAREVGGDFYDFIEIGEGKVGLVIGDVTGKSVSGALVMSAARSVFRMLSEQELTVGEIMMRANLRTKKDVKRGMFVALLFAVLDGKDRTLSLSSAGQTQPLFLSSQTGQATLLQTEGDNFPLGILDEAQYRETRIALAAGDKVVFYTDGIVEAMNAPGEIFGFERLLELVEGSQAQTAASLLRDIMERVNAFSGGAPQHDDLTVIVLNVTE